MSATLSPLKVMTVFGTRPEAIKLMPVMQRLKADRRFTSVAVATAQHRDMLDQVLKPFDFVPEYDLNVMQPGQTVTDVLLRVVPRFQSVVEKEKPHIVLVHGDTLTAFAAGLTAFYTGVSVGHVEAGLRSGHARDPFPEEMNRRLIGALAAWHFAPTASAKANLIKENVDPRSIFVTGNTVIDALLQQVIRNGPSGGTEGHDAEGRTCSTDSEGETAIDAGDVAFARWWASFADGQATRWLLLTTHRRENVGEPMRRIFRAVRRIVEALDDVGVVFPVHPNPGVRGMAQDELGHLPRVHLLPPLTYGAFARLMGRVTLVLTDSGGLQEEAPALGKPVLVLRETTERPEGVAAGTCRLVGTDEGAIVDAALQLLTDRRAYDTMARAVNPYGDGQAARRIVDAIAFALGREQTRPDEFTPS